MHSTNAYRDDFDDEAMPKRRNTSTAVLVSASSIVSAVVSILVTVLVVPRVASERVAPQSDPIPVTRFVPSPIVVPVIVEERMTKLATIGANSLIRIKALEAELAQLHASQRAGATARRDLALRVETLGKDFKRIPESEFGEAGFPQ